MDCGQQSNQQSNKKDKMEHLKQLTKEELAEFNRQRHIRNLKIGVSNAAWAVARYEKDIKETEEKLRLAKELLQRETEKLTAANVESQ